MTSDFDQTGLLTAHKNYILGQSFLLKNDPAKALAYFHKSQQLFKKELIQLKPSPTKNYGRQS